MGIDLSGSTPADPNRPKGILESIEDGLKNIGGVADSFASGLNGIVGMIADALFPKQPSSKAPLVRLNDGMTALYDQLDLMSEVSGYGGMILSKSYRVQGDAPYKKLPFDMQYGPVKNVTIDAEKNRFYLAKGTWSVSVFISHAEASGLGNGHYWWRGRFDVYQPDGTLFSQRWLDWNQTRYVNSVFYQNIVVLPSEGYYVEFWITYSSDGPGSARRVVFGGTDRSLFWVNRWDINTADAPSISSPPEVDL